MGTHARRWIWRALIGLVVLGLAACGMDELESGHGTLYRAGDSGLLEPTRLVVRDRASWEQTWDRMTEIYEPREPAPVVDFSRHMVLVAGMGDRPSGNYLIDILAIDEREDGYEVVVLEASPVVGSCPLTLAHTQPVIAVAVPRSDAPVAWVERKRRWCPSGYDPDGW